MDRELLCEILSALTGVTVRDHAERSIAPQLSVSGHVDQTMRNIVDRMRNGPAEQTANRSAELTVDRPAELMVKGPAELTVHNYISIPLLHTFRSSSCNAPSGLCISLRKPTQTDDSDADFDDSDACTTDGEPKEMFVRLEHFHDPQYDYDFRKISDLIVSRGGETYRRPKGWYRFALKVLGKYPDGNVWLGPNGWRNDSAAGEWPVSFHGTSLGGAEGVVEDHFKPGPGEVYGKGIYSTPDLSVAEGYARDKPFESKNGKKYRVILQNRINPAMRKICDRKGYWLIPIPKGTSEDEEERIVNKSIRPYGILVKEV